MSDVQYSQLLDRVDKLAMLYLEKSCDISSMTVEEYIKKFNEISEEIFKFCLKKQALLIPLKVTAVPRKSSCPSTAR